jgi:hypothetical protein
MHSCVHRRERRLSHRLTLGAAACPLSFRRQLVPLSAALAQFSYTDLIRAVPD